MSQFFENQDEARRRSNRLMLFFALGVLFVVLCVWLGLELTYHWIVQNEYQPYGPPPFRVHAKAFLWTLFIVGGTISFASWSHISHLASGGSSVALQLGGRNIDPATSHPQERQLVNIVEEMTIASGVPMPEIFVLDSEAAINAFAAGYTIDDAAVGVTRGALQLLTRDELQGVVAHEFSHILNGDMRLNIRAAGILHGLSVLSEIGRFLMMGAARHGSSSNQRGNPGAPLVVLGLVVFAAGYIGLVTGRVIRAAINREREYLADASAAQFTRNPTGLAGALRKIGALQRGGTWITHAFAEEYSHLFFTSVRSHTLLSSHPPLERRVRQLDRSWDGTWPSIDSLRAMVESIRAEAAAAANPLRHNASSLPDQPMRGAASAIDPVGAALPAFAAATAAVLGAVAEPPGASTSTDRAASPAAPQTQPATSDDPLAWAANLLASIPTPLHEAAHCATSALAIPLLLIATHSPSHTDAALDHIRKHAPSSVMEAVEALRPALAHLPRMARIPLLRLCAPTIRATAPAQREGLCTLLFSLAGLDTEWSLFELAVYRCVRAWTVAPPKAPTILSTRPVLGDIAALLSATAHTGGTDVAVQAYANGAGRFLELRNDGRSMSARATPRDVHGFMPLEALSLRMVDESIENLLLVAPNLRARVVDAVRHVILADGTITEEESELYAALLEVLGAPSTGMHMAGRLPTA